MRTATRRRTLAIALTVIAALGLSACAGGDVPVVDGGAGKPAVLRSVTQVRQVAQLTGPGAVNDTVSVGVAGTDLGSMVNVGEKTFFIFGDTFGERDADAVGGVGGLWRSNVLAWTTDADPRDGITFNGWLADDIGIAKPIIEGDHAGNDAGGEVTKIPTYGFAVGESIYVAYMSVRRWGDAGQWDANFAALMKSDDGGKSWHQVEGVRWPGDSNFVQFAAATVSEGGQRYVYLWAIPAGRFGGVKLMRVRAQSAAVERQDAYEYFAGTAEGGPHWTHDMAKAQTVLDGTIGELSVMWSTYLDRWIMTYSDGGNAYVREGATPWGPWRDPIQLVGSAELPGLYSPYLNPRYVSDDGRTIFFTLSQWGPYNVFWYSATLQK